jgi:GLPGLI family protein
MKFLNTFFLLFFLLFNIFKIISQSLKSEYISFYNMEYIRNDKTKSDEEFVMLIDKKNNKSVFLSSTIYVMDSIRKNDPNYMMFGSEFPEIVITENKKFNVFEDVIDAKLGYEEENKLKWKILEDTKKIGKYNAQLASCKAYGRTWFAWFTSDISLNFGPYKFNGLPGFIVSLYDSEKRFNFTLKQFKKKEKQYKLPLKKEYKFVEKNKYYKNRFKILTADKTYIIFKDAKERKKFRETSFKMHRATPKIDIEFPQE